MAKPKTTAAAPWPSSTLHSRIEHLARLLENLPSSIPLDPVELQYCFALDPDKIEERGVFGAAWRSASKLGAVKIMLPTSRNERDLMDLMKRAIQTMTESERRVFREVWLERLIAVAVVAGARVSARKRKQEGNQDMMEDGGAGLTQPVTQLSMSEGGATAKKSEENHCEDSDSLASEDLQESSSVFPPVPPTFTAPPAPKLAPEAGNTRWAFQTFDNRRGETTPRDAGVQETPWSDGKGRET